MARSGFRRLLRTIAWPAMGMVAAACILLSSCAAPTGHTLAKTTSNCGGLSISATAPSIPERIIALAAQASCNQLRGLSATYQQQEKATQITGTISGAIPRTSSQINASQERVKSLCFQIERALWTSAIPLQDVTVTILGPVYDDYFDQVISWYGTADLAARAAAQVDWHSVSADQAWTMFARTFLRVDYATFQQWGATPGASASPGNS